MSRIVIVKNYGIGNQLLATPLYTALKSLGHELVVVSEWVGTDAIVGHPALSGIVRWVPGHHSERDILNWLFRYSPDLAIASVPVHGTSTDRFLACAPRVMNTGKIMDWTRHEADVNLDYARTLGWQDTWLPTQFPIPDDLDAQVDREIARLDPHRPLVALHFGCVPNHNWRYKRWHLERFMDVATLLHQQTGCYLVLIGGPSERNEADQVFFCLDEAVRPYVLDLVAKTDLKTTGAWLRHAAVLISNDSGPMHMAAALETPVVALFGMSSPIKNAPWTDPTHPERVRVLTSDLWCRPCFGTRLHGACERGDCLDELRVTDVLNAVTDIARFS